MAAWTAATRQATQLSRFSLTRKATTTTPAATLIPRRGLAAGGGGDHHGPPKVNFWQDPLHPARWKEEHFVVVSLAGWGLLFYTGYKFFSGGKEEKKEEKVGDSAH